ncbi:hypothetical protein RHSIM_Rhsim10G0123300 [Rhododendron simsii]|uniref:Integrase zinc-binding domain-containing protein n=1 Tax=Rhododendron simsii TaxID=118357 RepID=A0A834LCV0_RHOSS|nr:hypothetical protein RHSIM_Rhsim10G0123300 [Rhododendron simsii]
MPPLRHHPHVAETHLPELSQTADTPSCRNPPPKPLQPRTPFPPTPTSRQSSPNALVTLASKVEVSGTPTKIEILKRTVPCSVAEIFPEEEIEDWRTPISNELKSTSAVVTLSNLKHFTIYQGVLYYRGSGGLLARCIGEEEAKVKIQEVHERSCGTGDVSLYRRLQHQGYYWPNMVTDGAELQNKCPKCRETPSKAECNFIRVYTDWRKPYIDFLTDGTLPPDRVDMAIVKKRAPKFFVLHDARPSELEALDERRDRAQANLCVYQRRISRAYDALVRPRQFAEGDLVLKAAPHVMKGKSASKFAAKWEGPSW